MQTVTLNNGVSMPLVGLGTYGLNGRECSQVVAKAIGLGYSLIDTAQMYGNEKDVGAGIKSSGVPRDRLFITTKIFRRTNSYAKAKKAIDESLANLQTDYVDLLLLHEPYREGLEMYRAMEEALASGKTREIGISNYNERLYPNFVKHCQVIPAVNQLECHVYFQKQGFQKRMEQDGVVLQAWSPLAQAKMPMKEQTVLCTIGEKYGKTAAQAALRFLVQRGISVVPKTRHEDRLVENMDILDFSLTDADMQAITGLDRNRTLFPWTEAF